MLDLIDRININTDLKKKLIDLAETDKVNILSLASKCISGNFNCLFGKNDVLVLAVIIECAAHTLNEYRHLGIPENIFNDTMSDIAIWCENNDNKGLKNYSWLKNHLTCQLFRIGRLQYQFYTCDNKKLNYDYFPFDIGEKVIYVHISQGERLLYADCLNSLRAAMLFFDTYFPEYKFNYFFCESWLLYDENYQFMEASSNIMQFSSLFDIVCSYDDDKQAIERIFGKRQLNKNKYQENTSLQKSVKAYLLNKGKLGEGIGIIYKNDLL